MVLDEQPPKHDPYAVNRWSRWRRFRETLDSKRDAKWATDLRVSSFPNKCKHGRQHR